jgi:hypothetical protein
VSQSTHTRWEDFAGNNEGGGVGAKVEEELSNDDEGEATSGANLVVGTSEDTEHEGSDKEALNLDPFTAEKLNEGNGKEVSRNVTGNGNNQVTFGVLEKVLVRVLSGSVSDIGKNDRLIQVDSVESNIDQEPGHGATEKGEGVSPVLEVLDESCHLNSLGWLNSVCLNDGDPTVLNRNAIGSLKLLLGGERRQGARGIGDRGELNALQELAGFRHGQAEVEEGETWDESKTDLQTPDGIDVTEMAIGERVLENGKKNASNDGSGQSTLRFQLVLCCIT